MLLNFFRYVDEEKFDWFLVFFHGNGKALKNYTNQKVTIYNFAKNEKFTLNSLYQIIRFIRKNKFDIIHTHLVHAGIIGKILGFVLRTPCVFSTRHYTYMEKERSFFYHLEDLLSRFLVTKVISISESVTTYLQKLGIPKNKIVLIYNGIDINFFRINNSVQREPNSLISVGRLVPAKGYKILIKALELLKNDSLDFKCIIIGDGPLKQELLSQVQEKRLSKYIEFLGEQDLISIRDYLQKSSVYISSSLYEGFSLSLLEAMACGNIVIATKAGTSEEIIENGVNGLLVDPSNPQDLKNKIKFALLNEETQKYRRAANLAVKKSYSIENMVVQTQKLYMNCLKNKNNLMSNV